VGSVEDPNSLNPFPNPDPGFSCSKHKTHCLNILDFYIGFLALKETVQPDRIRPIRKWYH